MDNVAGLHGWAWIFIIEGLLTVALGIISRFFVQDFPDESRFLSREDKIRCIRRLVLDQDRPPGQEEFSFKYLYAAFRDYKMWLGMLTYCGCDMSLYAFSLYLPSLIKELGFGGTHSLRSIIEAQLLTVPPYTLAAVATILVGKVADKTHQRAYCNIIMVLIGIAG
jgi:MFS family permease